MKNTIKANVTLVKSQDRNTNIFTLAGLPAIGFPKKEYESVIDKFHMYLTIPYSKDNILSHIKEGDWYTSLYSNSTSVHKYTGELNGDFDNNKIIGSTDEKLNLPLIPEQFVTEYVNKQGNIKEVLVEIENWSARPYQICDDNIKIKDKYCIIHLIKDSYTREEVKQLMWEAYVANEKSQSPDYISKYIIPRFDEWFKEQNF